MKHMVLALASCLALGGCVSISDLSQEKPTYTGELSGNYFDLAECTKAQHSRAAPMVRIDLLHDKPQKEATVTWNHEFGAMNAFVFKEIDPTHTRLTVYSAVANSEGLVRYSESCQPSQTAKQ